MTNLRTGVLLTFTSNNWSITIYNQVIILIIGQLQLVNNNWSITIYNQVIILQFITIR